jgi:FkbM family methyltransferase
MAPVLQRWVTPEAVVFDVGGHAGQFAKLFAKMARRGQVYSFEPGGYPRSILRLAIAANRLGNITIVSKGLGDQSGTLTLNTPLKPGGVRRFGVAHLGQHAETQPAKTEVVPITTIDLFAAERGIERLDFIKLDVEGWELRVLSGGAETSESRRPAMLIELVDAHLARAGDTVAAAWATLGGWGYRPFAWHGGEALVPLDTPRDGDTFWLPPTMADSA